VCKIVPIDTERSLVKLTAEGATKDGESSKLVRWRAIVREAAEQCERAMIPDVVCPVRLLDYLEQSCKSGFTTLICAERKGAQTLSNLLASETLKKPAPSLVVLIGPEGGFAENEFRKAEELDVVPVSLGKRILRSETAAVYAASLLMGHLDR